jgi:hypothetical protein
VRADQVARVALETVAVASGTGAFVALATGHKTTAIGLAVLGGVLGVGAALGEGLERENGHAPVPATPAPQAPQVVGTAAPVMAGFAGGRMLGRGGGGRW